MVICREVRTVITLAKYIMSSAYIVNRSSYDDQTARTKHVDQLKKIHNTLTQATRGIECLCISYNDAAVSGELLPLVGEISNCCGLIEDIES